MRSLLNRKQWFVIFIYSSVKYPGAITSVIEADYHQKVVMKFSLKSTSSGDLFTPHQAFVRLTNEKTKQEIFFVAEPEPSKVFKFDLVSCSIQLLFFLWLTPLLVTHSQSISSTPSVTFLFSKQTHIVSFILYLWTIFPYLVSRFWSALANATSIKTNLIHLVVEMSVLLFF